jgi:hypothetical protein
VRGPRGFFQQKFLNEADEGSSLNPLVITVPSIEYDFCDANHRDPRTRLCLDGQLSDWVLFDSFKVSLLSDNAETSLAHFTGAVQIDQDFAILHPFNFRFVSDTDVPEPASINLILIALVPVGMRIAKSFFKSSSSHIS